MPATLAMPTTTRLVTDEQVRFYVEQGYLVVPGLVAQEELDLLKQDLVHLARGGYPCPSLKPLPSDFSDDQVLENLLCVHQPHYLSPVMRSFVDHPGIAAVLARIVGAHLTPGWWDGAVKCMQSMLFVKPPGKPGQAWHQDEIYIPTRDRSLTGGWIAIDDATRENGCLYVLPGSHRPGYLYPSRSHQRTDEFDFGGESHGFDESGEVAVEVKAGSVVFFNGYLLHRSRRNRSRVYRRALVNHYMTAQSLLPWAGAEQDVRDGKTSVALCDFRTVIPVCGTDPYAWKGYTPGGQDVHLRSFDAEAIAKAPH
ncbi:MAG: phytanoyl-CoA dioxygenase family protein [Planctomycetes bacterium]|nr:phytanoyl-CoA dioxygenase family protein [Planctomycetota bacterium]